MRIIWSPEAIDDLAALRAYIAKDDAPAAQRIVAAVTRHIHEILPHHPEIGRVGRVPGTRELVIPRPPFLVPYRVTGDALLVLRVFHGRRRWPESL